MHNVMSACTGLPCFAPFNRSSNVMPSNYWKLTLTNIWCAHFNLNREWQKIWVLTEGSAWTESELQLQRVGSLSLSPIPLTTPNRSWEPALRSTAGPLKRPDWCLEHLNWQLVWRSAKRSLYTDRMNLTHLRPTRSWELCCRLSRGLRSKS